MQWVTPGTRPTGISEEQEAARYVRDLFSRIADRYDLLNHLLSCQADRYWRRTLARSLRKRLREPGCRALDLCCGTGDQALALAREGPTSIVACDFAHPMLLRAREKLRRAALPEAVTEADALRLPFSEETFDVVACSFGFRNLTNYRAGLMEIRRILRKGGQAAILEFSEPRGWVRPLYSFYFHRVLPRVGEWISGAKGSYSYLPDSVDRFPAPEQIVAWMEESRFAQVQAKPLTAGIVTLFSGTKQ